MKTIFKLLSIITLTLVIFTSCSTTSSLRGRVYMNDGSVRMGIIGLPSPTTKTVGIIPAGQDDVVKLTSQDINHITVWHEKAGEDKPSKLIYTNWIELNKKGEQKVSKKKIWMLTMTEQPYLSAYATGESYSVNADGSATTYTTTNSIGAPDIWFYVRRPNEDMPTKIAISNAGTSIFLPANRFFKRWGPHYFSDCPELVEKIKDKDVKVRTTKELATVILLYGDCKKSKVQPKAKAQPEAQPKSQEKSQPAKKK